MAVTTGTPRLALAPHNPGVISVASAVMFAGAIYPQVKGGQKPSGSKLWRRVWAIMLLTLILAAADDFVPQITKPFSMAMVVGTLAWNGWFGFTAPSSSTAPPGSRQNPVQTTPHQ